MNEEDEGTYDFDPEIFEEDLEWLDGDVRELEEVDS